MPSSFKLALCDARPLSCLWKEGRQEQPKQWHLPFGLLRRNKLWISLPQENLKVGITWRRHWIIHLLIKVVLASSEEVRLQPLNFFCIVHRANQSKASRTLCARPKVVTKESFGLGDHLLRANPHCNEVP